MSPNESSPLNCYTLEQTLTRLGLQQYLEVLQAENVDLESLVICIQSHRLSNTQRSLSSKGVVNYYRMILLKALCQDSDLKELGIPLGPRKKILNYVRRRWLSEVRRGQTLSRFCLFLAQPFYVHVI